MIDITKKECWNNALMEAGMGYVFRQRALKLNKSVKTTKVIAVLVPMIPGAFVLAYEAEGIIYQIIMWAFGVLSIYLAIRSGVSLVYGHDDRLSYSYESASHHASLSLKFENLANMTSVDTEQAKIMYSELIGEQRVRDQQDDKVDITPKEERKAMCYGLRQYSRSCAGCSKVPTSLSPKNCEVCGNF